MKTSREHTIKQKVKKGENAANPWIMLTESTQKHNVCTCKVNQLSLSEKAQLLYGLPLIKIKYLYNTLNYAK